MIEHYLANLGNYIQQHPYIGELVTFLIAFAESLPLIGTIIPGSVTMTIIGILVGRNTLPLFLTLLLATLGALCGDIIGFAVGKYYNERLRDMWPFKTRPHWLTMGESFFLKHGGKSILLGRFVGPARSSVPLFAGLLKMRWSKFLIAAIPSAVLWALLYIVPGIILGAISLAIPKEKATTFTLIGLGVIVVLWLIFWAIQRFFVYLAIQVNMLVDRTWSWLNHHHASKPIIRLITNQLNPRDHYQLMRVFLACVCFSLFLVIYLSAIFQVGLYHLNEPLFSFVQTLRSLPLDKVFVLITGFGDKYMLLTATLLIAAYFALRRDWYTFWHVITVTLVTFVLVTIFKTFSHSPRPTGFMIVHKSSSLPSGHATESLAILGFFSFLIARSLPKKYHWLPYTLVSLLVATVMFSRLYLGAHWFCDVISGALLGATILLLFITSYHRREPQTLAPQFVPPLIIALLVSWGIYSGLTFQHELHRYQPIIPKESINLNQWWENPTAYTPLYRANRFGHPQQPFNLQWAGNVKAIQAYLTARGWKNELNNKETLKKALSRFASKSAEQHIAFLKQLYLHKAPVLFVIKLLPKQKNIIELRLWQSGIKFQDVNQSLYIGSLNYHKPARSLFSLKPHLQITLENGGGVTELITALGENYDLKKVAAPTHTVPQRLRYLKWDKQILIIKRNHH